MNKTELQQKLKTLKKLRKVAAQIESLNEAKKLILKEVKSINSDISLKHLGCSNEISFNPKDLNIMQIQILMEVFGIDVEDYNKEIFRMMKLAEEVEAES